MHAFDAARLTGATIVRQIKPGQGVTMDYRRERVTIETDSKTRKIVRAFCG
ncbi:MAG: I78 family peptidase inhibitor [Rhodanobacteraceae bacterium]